MGKLAINPKRSQTLALTLAALVGAVAALSARYAIVELSRPQPPAYPMMMDELDRDIKILMSKELLTPAEQVEIERLETKRHRLVAGQVEYGRIMSK